MSDNAKKALKWSSIGLLLIAIVVILWLYLPAIKGNITNEKYYTQQEMDKAVEDAYNKGVGNKQNFEEQIKTLKIELTTAQENYQDTAKQLAIAQSQNSADKTEIAQLKESISSKEQKISELHNRIAYLENLLEEYGETSLLTLTFYSNEKVHDVQLVENEGYLDMSEVTAPVLMGYSFDYWTLDGQTEIDFSTLQIIEDLNIYAKFTALDNDITLKFAVNGSLHEAEVAGRFMFNSCTDEYTEKPISAYKATYSRVESGSTLVVDIYLNNSFTFAPLAENNYYTSAFNTGSTCKTSITAIEVCDFEKTGFTYHTQLTITDINCSGEITFFVEPIYYKVKINDPINDLNYIVENVVYGRKLDLQNVLTKEQQDSITSATTSAGGKFAGIYTSPNGQGTQYYDSELNVLSNLNETGYIYDGGKYIKADWFDEEERILLLYIGYSL